MITSLFSKWPDQVSAFHLFLSREERLYSSTLLTLLCASASATVFGTGVVPQQINISLKGWGELHFQIGHHHHQQQSFDVQPVPASQSDVQTPISVADASSTPH